MVADLVSTIIPVYNRSALLRDAVETVIQQTYRPIEIIIIDDGSSDGSFNQARALQRDHSEITTIVKQDNAGPGAAREVGRQQSIGEFIQYLDSDDLLDAEKFRTQVQGLQSEPDCCASYGRSSLIDRTGRLVTSSLAGTGQHIRYMFPAFLKARLWTTSTPLYRADALDAIGPWTCLRNEEDWEYDCRLAKLAGKLHYCDKTVSTKREQDDGQSRNSSVDRRKLRDRTEAHKLIYNHARSASIDYQCAEMKHFARELFLLARQCGAAGLSSISRELFALAKQASGPERARGWDFMMYQSLARVCGWRTAGRLAGWSDRFRA